MVNAEDVAEYILKKQGSCSAMKLQKLVYYSQAWSLVFNEKPLFMDRIEAWVGGPVVVDLYKKHKGTFSLETGFFTKAPTELGSNAIKTVELVLKAYGSKTAQWLSDLTHSEKPWIDARKGIPDDGRGSNEITHAAMGEYYSSLGENASVLASDE